MRRFDSSYREMKAILDISENGAVRLNDQELSPRADFHEWHHYPKVDDTEVAKQSPLFPRSRLSQHVRLTRTAESRPPAAENRPDPSSRTRSPQFRQGQF